jgi:putative ABC transport system permease protein
MLLTLAWRNVWRNRRRSLILLAAIALGLWGGLFATGIMVGFMETFVNSAIDRDLGHLQLHTPAFAENRLLADDIPSADSLAHAIRALSDVRGVSPRMLVNAMASSAVSAHMVGLVGVDPAEERKVSSVPASVQEGSYLEEGRMFAVIGETLAKKLGLRLRSKIVLSFQGIDGSIVYGGFRVAGIYRTESSVFDGATVFVRREELARLVGMESAAHELAVRLETATAVERTVDTLRALYPTLETKGWKELAPELRITAESTGVTMFVFLGIILLALLFGITNTMLMSVLDRVREFGVLMAVGMRRRRLFGLILVETVLLAVTGAIGGMLLGGATVRFFAERGINLSWFAEGLAFYGMPVILRPILPPMVYLWLILMVVGTAILGAVYPAMKSVRLRPASAIRSYG